MFLTFGFKNLSDGAFLLGHDAGVGVDERVAESFGKLATDGRLSCAHESNKYQVLQHSLRELKLGEEETKPKRGFSFGRFLELYRRFTLIERRFDLPEFDWDWVEGRSSLFNQKSARNLRKSAGLFVL